MKIYFLLVSALLTACNLAPMYERPELPIECDQPLDETTVMASEISWETFFASPVLHDLIQTALENNRDLRMAAWQVEAAFQQYRMQAGERWPPLDFTANALRQKLPGHATHKSHGNILSDYGVGVNITAFELDFFGRLHNLAEREFNLYLASDEAQKSVKIALIAEVAYAYLGYISNLELLALTEHTLKAETEGFELIKKSHALGNSSDLALAQATTLIESARSNHFRFQREADQAKNALQLLVGMPIECLHEDFSLVKELPAGIPSEVLLLRPDIRQAEYELIAAHADLGAARAACFPSIVLTGSLGYGSDHLLGLWPKGSGLAWSWASQISAPLFHAGALQANTARSEALRQIALAHYEKTIQTAFCEVADELVARATLSQQWETQKALIAAWQKTHDLSQARYKQGLDSFLNVLDSQRALYAAQQEEIRLHQQYLTNLITLYKVLGGGQL